MTLSLKDDALITACREIASLYRFFELSAEMTAEDLTTEQYTLLEQAQEFAEERLRGLCHSLRDKIKEGG